MNHHHTLPWNITPGMQSTNMQTHELRTWARQMLTSSKYRAALETSLIARTCPPAIESLLYYYAYGKPVENVNLNVTQGQEDLSQLSIPELADRAQAIQDALREAQDLENAISATVTQVPVPNPQKVM